MSTIWRSFRDPAGRTEVHDDRVVRHLDAAGASALRAFLATPAAARLESDGRLIATREDGAAPAGGRFMHPRVEFPSFPGEWPAAMLHAAAALTLDVAREAFACGYLLKDASPYNVLFRDASPVFIDLGSFEPWREGAWLWPAAAQFERCFLLPLLAWKLIAEPPHLLYAASDALPPEALAPRLRGLARWHPLALRYALLPALLGRSRRAQVAAARAPAPAVDPARARFVIETLFARLGRALARLDPGRIERDTAWSDYARERPYDAAALARKDAFVAGALDQLRPRRVLDIGCNDGRYSRIAARAGASVVAFDKDAETVGRVWREARREGLPILPMAIDLARPTPEDGWRNAERPGFLSRARGHFDAGLFLACFHHLVVTERVPVALLVELLADFGFRALLFEYIDPADPMFRMLLRGRDALYGDLDASGVERDLRRHFVIRRAEQIAPTRRLYLLERNPE